MLEGQTKLQTITNESHEKSMFKNQIPSGKLCEVWPKENCAYIGTTTQHRNNIHR